MFIQIARTLNAQQFVLLHEFLAAAAAGLADFETELAATFAAIRAAA
jgi:hypothetical protein